MQFGSSSVTWLGASFSLKGIKWASDIQGNFQVSRLQGNSIALPEKLNIKRMQYNLFSPNFPSSAYTHSKTFYEDCGQKKILYYLSCFCAYLREKQSTNEEGCKLKINLE